MLRDSVLRDGSSKPSICRGCVSLSYFSQKGAGGITNVKQGLEREGSSSLVLFGWQPVQGVIKSIVSPPERVLSISSNDKGIVGKELY